MKKFKMLALVMAIGALVCGCGCSKVDENTYTNAVNTYKNTDAISFTRLEMISKQGETTYTRKKTDAKYTMNASKTVVDMEYSHTVSTASNSGGSTTNEVTKYYYVNETSTLYTYTKTGTKNEQQYKESNIGYNDRFNINSCTDAECLRMIVGSFAPVFDLNEITNFAIVGEDGNAKVSFSAVCPSYENCESNSQLLDYNLTISSDGNIESMEYEIVNGDTTYTVKYTFYAYGSNNVKINFPSNLSSYIEKKS